MKVYCFVALISLFALGVARGQIIPKKLLIYYAYPSVINNASSIDAAASEFGQYDYVVLGDGIELMDHPDRANTQAILGRSITTNTRFFGYVDLGVSTQNRTIADVQSRIDLWKSMGADGIFFDDFGYDYLVSRQRQNDAVTYAHTQGLPVIANGWNPDEVFGNAVNTTYNPSGTATVLGSNDFYLSESYLVTEGNYQNPTDWKIKADKLKTYQASVGFKILSITTNSTANTYDQTKFNYAWYGAFLYGHEAVGWGEIYFSAGNAQAPFRPRPAITTPGTSYLNDVKSSGDEVFRFTNAGKIWINTNTHASGFTPATTCISLSSGAWANAATWSCGRVPFPVDSVTVQAMHSVTISSPSDVAQTRLDGKVIYTSGGRLRYWPAQ